ncbi:MAG: prepilin-type N-terminal cleavage/methylation domain-containing protein [Phycisphaerales bacterium]|nr:MAG: prepilin-type N-terminal cleavage/methylation domain-containing protein [Phycisphaerales bacterium]
MNRSPRARRAFSMIEVLISLAITGTLLAAALAALDASFKSYKVTSEGASTHVVTRMVMYRLMTMIRTGTEFGPYPADVLNAAQNPLNSTFIEFTTNENAGAGTKQIVRIERRDTATVGTYELWYVQKDYAGGTLTSTQARPLLVGVKEATFELQYDVGPRLKKATVDLTVLPNDLDDASIGSSLQTPTIRMVSSVSPRKLD